VPTGKIKNSLFLCVVSSNNFDYIDEIASTFLVSCLALTLEEMVMIEFQIHPAEIFWLG